MKAISPWMLIPYPVRVGMWIALLAIAIWAWFSLDSALEAHYTAQQNVLVAEDAARTNAATARLMQRQRDAARKQAAVRQQRLAAAGQRIKEQDDEMERLKGQSPEVRDWAKAPVPEPVRARHQLR